MQLPLQSLQLLLAKQTAKVITEADLIDCEAGVVFLEEMVNWLETMVEIRKKKAGRHFTEVELKVRYIHRQIC